MSNSSMPPRMCAEISVLVLDDDETFRSALAANLREDGHAVFDYRDPREVPAIATLGHVGLVITDYQMLSVNGLTFADAFHKAHKRVPIVMVSGSVPPDVERMARRFVYLWRKPLEYEDLHKFLHRLWNLRNAKARESRRRRARLKDLTDSAKPT